MSAVRYEDVVAARERISARLRPTPLLRAHDLEEELGYPVYLKCELFQVTGSFKARGALNWIRSATREELEPGLVTISAGNHALALAWAAREVGASLKVVMPEGSSPMKVAATRRYGAEVVLHGDINGAMQRLEEIRAGEGRTLVHPFDDPRVIAGQGTVGLEIAEALPEVAEVLCPVGGGGLVSGLALALKRAHPRARVIGLEPERAPTLRAAWDRGEPVRLAKVDTVAASLGASLAGAFTYPLSRKWVDAIETLSEEAIVAGLRATFARGRLFAEPGAVLGVAVLLRKERPAPGGPTVAVITGGNLDLALARELLAGADPGASRG